MMKVRCVKIQIRCTIRLPPLVLVLALFFLYKPIHLYSSYFRFIYIPLRIGTKFASIPLFSLAASLSPLPFISTFNRDFLNCIKVGNPSDVPINITELLFWPVIQTNIVLHEFLDIPIQ